MTDDPAASTDRTAAMPSRPSGEQSPGATPSPRRHSWVDDVPAGRVTTDALVAVTRSGVHVFGLLGRVAGALDDLAALRRSAEFIADNLSDLSRSASGIDQNAAEIAREITGLSHAAQGIDDHAAQLSAEIESVAKLVPTLQRLTEIVDPLDNTVVRLGRFVDRLPGGRRNITHGP